MTLLSESNRRDSFHTSVRRLSELEREIRCASVAIAQNRLRDLEESLWRQEILCRNLKSFVSTICPAILDRDSINLLRETAARLKMQSQIYEKLVARSSRSTAILQHLCTLYRNAAQQSGTGMYRPMSREA